MTHNSLGIKKVKIFSTWNWLFLFSLLVYTCCEYIMAGGQKEALKSFENAEKIENYFISLG